MNKITYLFGAGASKGALPIVNEIPERLQLVIDLLSSKDMVLSDTEKHEDLNRGALKSKRHFQLDLIEDLKWLHAGSQDHASVDTFAKKLFIRSRGEDLDRLKIALSIFFVIEQTRNGTDKRYDAFFASIHNELFRFPENLRVLSWNYDYQFELTYSQYSGLNELTANQSSLNIIHKYGRRIKGREGFQILKLNGTTGIYSDGGWKHYQYLNDLHQNFDKLCLDEIVHNYTAIKTLPNFYPNFSFAWEGENPDNSIVDVASQISKDTVALVVIGYSFPFFNREVDRKIIGSMSNLKSVYFQAPDADVLAERFKAIRDDLDDVKLITRYDLEQFVLPNEL